MEVRMTGSGKMKEVSSFLVLFQPSLRLKWPQLNDLML